MAVLLEFSEVFLRTFVRFRRVDSNKSAEIPLPAILHSHTTFVFPNIVINL